MATLNGNKKYKLIIIAGQSNAVGQATAEGNLTGIYESWQAPYPSVRMAQQIECPDDSKAAACTTEDACFEVAKRTHSTGAFGCELGIARAIPNIKSWAASGNIIIVKCATGATDLADDWDPTLGGADFALYERMIEFVQNPRQIWANSYEVVGFVWIQGEQDATVEAQANAYEDNLNALIAQLRTDVSKSSLPCIISRLSADNVATYAATIRTAQDAVAAADSNVTTVTPTPGLGVDNVHFVANGYCQLGIEDIGPALDAYYDLLGDPPAAAPLYTSEFATDQWDINDQTSAPFANATGSGRETLGNTGGTISGDVPASTWLADATAANSDRLICSGAVAGDSNSQDLALRLAIKCPNFGAGDYLFGKWDGSTGTFATLSANGQVTWFLDDGPTRVSVSLPAGHDDDNWHILSFFYDDSANTMVAKSDLTVTTTHTAAANLANPLSNAAILCISSLTDTTGQGSPDMEIRYVGTAVGPTAKAFYNLWIDPPVS